MHDFRLWVPAALLAAGFGLAALTRFAASFGLALLPTLAALRGG